VQPTHESQLHLYGTIGGRRVPASPSIIDVNNIVEKPTPTLAEQELFISGLRAGNYYCFFGIHALTPAVMKELDAKVQPLGEGETLGLTPTLAHLARSEKYLAVEIDGQRFNIGERYGLLRAQLSLALAGPHRDEILTMLIETTANSRP
jgi:UTP--glucose-1-phosphate uridylyltransferase